MKFQQQSFHLQVPEPLPPHEGISELILCKSDGCKGYLSFYRHVKHTYNVTQNPEQMDV